MAKAPGLAALALIVNALVWGLSWWPFKHLQGLGLHPLWATAVVYALALAVLSLRVPHGWPRLLRTPWLWALAAASGFTNVGFNWAVTTGDVVRVVLLFYVMPVWSVPLAWWLLGERPRRAALLRLALALTGVALVLHAPGQGLPWPLGLADALALLGGFCFALTNALLRRLRAEPEAGRMLAMFAGGALFALVTALAGRGLGHVSPLPEWSPALIGPTLGLALAFLVGNLCLQYGAARLPASTTALIMLSEVVFASVSASLAGEAEITPRVLSGGTLILGAALLASLPSPNPAPASSARTPEPSP